MWADPNYWTATPELGMLAATVSFNKAIMGERLEIPKAAGNNNLETVEGKEWALGGRLNHYTRSCSASPNTLRSL